MRIAIISDLHLGDPTSTLVKKGDHPGEMHVDDVYYPQFKQAARGEDSNGNHGQMCDYLILLGDIIDFAVVSYKDAYDTACTFFQKILQDHIAEEIIYIPGNHDFELWHICEYEVNIINRIKEGQPIRSFRWSVPCVIDDRLDIQGKHRGKFELFSVKPLSTSNNKNKYGGLYLDHIIKKGKKPAFTFNFANPNLYLMTEEANVLITHGHYFNPYWSLLGRLAPKVFGADFNQDNPLTLKDIVATNFPLCQLASSGTGQAGPLTHLIDFIQRSATQKDKKGLEKIYIYLNRLFEEIDNLTDYAPLNPAEWVTDLLANRYKHKIVNALEHHTPDRHNDSWMTEPLIQSIFKQYFEYTRKEIEEINHAYELNGKTDEKLALPAHIIFGHTHCPLPWDPAGFTSILSYHNEPLHLYNTGGWLKQMEKNGDLVFDGAEVITYQTGQGFKSHSIR